MADDMSAIDLETDSKKPKVDWDKEPAGLGPVLMAIVLTSEVITLFTPANLHAVVFFGLIGSLWSLKNVLIGPLKVDAGIITNTLVFVAYCLQNKTFQIVAPSVLCGHFGFAALRFIPTPSIAIAKKLKKSTSFVNFLKGYIGGTTIYWGIIAYMRSGEDDSVGGFEF